MAIKGRIILEVEADDLAALESVRDAVVNAIDQEAVDHGDDCVLHLVQGATVEVTSGRYTTEGGDRDERLRTTD